MSHPIAVRVPPFLYNARDGKRYAISGEHWIEVPLSTMFSDLPKYMVWDAAEPLPVTEERSWPVEGSKGNIYTVKCLQNDVWTCTCPGFGWRRKCKHIKATKSEAR